MRQFPLSRVLSPPLVFMAMLLGTLLLIVLPRALAQLGGENLRGDYGMKSGSQGPPGFYLGDIFYFCRTDTVKNLNGDDRLKAPAIDIFGNYPEQLRDQEKDSWGQLCIYVALPILNSELALPTLDVGSQTWGLADMYIKPVELGWHFKHALEGGAGRAFLQGYANAGLAYVGQWKVSEDSGRDVSLLVQGKKDPCSP